MKRDHATMAEAQEACRKLREHRRDPRSQQEARRIERQWITHPDYESDHSWLTRKQAGARP